MYTAFYTGETNAREQYLNRACIFLLGDCIISLWSKYFRSLSYVSVSYPGIRYPMMSCCAVCQCSPRSRALSLRCWCRARTRREACSPTECPGLKKRKSLSSAETSLTETRGQTLASGTVEKSSHCPALSAGWRPESDSLPLKREQWRHADSQVCARVKSRSQNLSRLLALPLYSSLNAARTEKQTGLSHKHLCIRWRAKSVLRLDRPLIEELKWVDLSSSWHFLLRNLSNKN